MELIDLPLPRVVVDVMAETGEGRVTTNDVFVVVALPNGLAWGVSQLIDEFRGLVFEVGNDLPQSGALRGLGWGRVDSCGAGLCGAGCADRTPTVGGLNQEDAVEMVGHGDGGI